MRAFVRSVCDAILRRMGDSEGIAEGGAAVDTAPSSITESEQWTEARIEELINEASAHAAPMHKFPFAEFLDYYERRGKVFPNWLTSGLWSFGTAYRDLDSKVDPGPAGWYGYAHEFGGTDLPDRWFEISRQFGEKVYPQKDSIMTDSGTVLGMHIVGPERDPTSALIAIMRYVHRLHLEKEAQYLALFRDSDEDDKEPRDDL